MLQDITLSVYTVEQAFEVLSKYKITSNPESVRRWLRHGDLKGNKPDSRKQGWTIPAENLSEFIEQRLPDVPVFNTNDDVLKEEYQKGYYAATEDFYHKYKDKISDSVVVITKTLVQQNYHKYYSSLSLRRQNKEEQTAYIDYVWKAILANADNAKKIRVKVFLDRFDFAGETLYLSSRHATDQDSVVFAILIHLLNPVFIKDWN